MNDKQLTVSEAMSIIDSIADIGLRQAPQGKALEWAGQYSQARTAISKALESKCEDCGDE
mgnify:CR=1 FL=1